MKLEKWLWSAPAWRANLEGWLLALVLLASLGMVAGDLTDSPFFDGIVLVGAFIPSLIGLRLAFMRGPRMRILLLELLQAGLVTAGLTLLDTLLKSLFGASQGFIRLHQMPDVLVFTVSAAVYLFWRVFGWGWVRWDAEKSISEISWGTDEASF